MAKQRGFNLAVTGLIASDNPAPGVAVIRSIKIHEQFKGKVIGLVYDALEPGIYMEDIVDYAYLIPYPSEGEEGLLARLEYINSINKIDVLIPTLDVEIFSFIKLSHKLSSMGIHTFLPTEEQFNLRSKVNLNQLCKKYSIDVPKTKEIFDTSSVYTLNKEFEFPVMVKGLFYEAYIAYSIEEILMRFSNIKAKWGLPIIIQEHIIGEEYDVVGLGDGEGKVIGSVGMKKVFLTDKGKAWSGLSIKDPYLLEITKRLIEGMKWRGGLEVEILKAKDGKYYLIEINPRFPAWVYLSVGAGQNLPYALFQLALGKKVTPFEDYTAGTLFIRASYDIISSISALEAISTTGELTKTVKEGSRLTPEP